MCGIAGVIDIKLNSIPSSYLSSLSEAISHRGPDDDGFYSLREVGLVHSRLSILDKSQNSSQPMISQDRRYVLIYNGEVYNFADLRSELTKLGIHFKTTSDTEVVLQALIAWGSNAVLKFNGMFSFAFLDTETRKMLLARDRYGIKPLYYYYTGSKFVFASEEKAIKQLPFFETKLDVLALSEYLTFQNIFSDRTFYDGITSLSPGFQIELSIQQDTIDFQIHRYWDFEFNSPEDSQSIVEQEEELDFLLQQAITRCLISEVPLGQYLSGGIDTALIAAEASKHVEFMPTFTVGFDENRSLGIEGGFDERPEARALAHHLGTLHTEYVLAPGDMQSCLRELTECLDTPRVGQSYPNFFAARMAAEKVKVVLSGTGSDELFGGYPWRYFNSQFAVDANTYVNSYYKYWQRIVNDDTKKLILKPIWGEVKDYETRDVFSNILANHNTNKSDKHAYLNNSLYLEAKTFLVGLLNIEDKIHMHFGIENRVPFLDNDLVNFAMRCHPKLKFKVTNFSTKRIDENVIGDKKRMQGFSESGKLILQRKYRRDLPQFNGWQYKRGFSGPDSSWFRGQSLSYVKMELLNPRIPLYNFVDYKSVKLELESHFSGERNLRLFIWSLLSIKNWISLNL